MQHILSRACLPLLAGLAHHKTLCAFDFDGTLAPIVPDPPDAAMRARTRELMCQMAQLYPCAIFSGRARSDLREKLRGIAVRELVGNHGAEQDRRSSMAAHPPVATWIAALDASLEGMAGVWTENKGLSIAVHYRQQPNKAEARRRILQAVRFMDGVRIVRGKQVINIMPDHAPHKGEALLASRDRLGCDWILYVGDDVNDEDAFGVSGNIIPVRVGKRRHSKARYFVKSQNEIDDLLEAVVNVRKPPCRGNV